MNPGVESAGLPCPVLMKKNREKAQGSPISRDLLLYTGKGMKEEWSRKTALWMATCKR